MLESIPGWKLREWEIYEELDPDQATRLEWSLARIVQILVKDGRPLKDFLLPFGDTPPPEVPKQTLEQQTRMLDAWFSGSNAILKQKEKGRK